MAGDFVRPAALVWPNNACLAGRQARGVAEEAGAAFG